MHSNVFKLFTWWLHNIFRVITFIFFLKIAYTMLYCGAEISGPSGCKLGDVGCLAKLPFDILQDVPVLETSELCNSPVLDSESFGESKPSLICKQYNVLSGVKQTNKLQVLYENSKTKGAIKHAAQKQKQFKWFQTVNHARVIWD